MSLRKSVSRVSGLLVVGSVLGLAVGGTVPALAGTAAGPFLRGDSNGSGNVDIADAVATLAYLFSAGAAPECLDAADVNDDGAINLADPVSALTYLFSGGSVPIAPPFPDAGYDPTADGFECEVLDCISGAQLAAELTLGTVSVTVVTPPVTYNPSVLGIGLLDVTFNLNNTIPVQFGAMTYNPATGVGTLANSTFPIGASLVIDGPLLLDFSCTATVTVGASGSVTFDQDLVSPELILIYDVADMDIDLTVQNISLASCGLTGAIFDVVYPLISGYVNGIVNGPIQNAVAFAVDNILEQEILGLIDPSVSAIAVCAP